MRNSTGSTLARCGKSIAGTACYARRSGRRAGRLSRRGRRRCRPGGGGMPARTSGRPPGERLSRHAVRRAAWSRCATPIAMSCGPSGCPCGRRSHVPTARRAGARRRGARRLPSAVDQAGGPFDGSSTGGRQDEGGCLLISVTPTIRTRRCPNEPQRSFELNGPWCHQKARSPLLPWRARTVELQSQNRWAG